VRVINSWTGLILLYDDDDGVEEFKVDSVKVRGRRGN
jgi:hypothetical protein